MNLRELIEGSGNGAVVQQMARELGLGEADTRRAIDKMVSALARGIQRNAAQPPRSAPKSAARSNGIVRRQLARQADALFLGPRLDTTRHRHF